MADTSILVVDDDADICSNLADILGDRGYRVDTAHDSNTALSLVKEKSYELALLDFRMPGMDGASLYEHICKLQPGLVAVMITAYAGGDGVQRAKNAGLWHVLQKPVDVDKVLQLVEQALDQPLVLLVDDDPDFCLSLRDVLREHGFRVGIANDVATATDEVGSRPYHIVLLDLNLGEASGEEVFRCISAQSPQPRTVIVTGFRREKDSLVKRLIAAGANAVCYKPVDVPQLLSQLQPCR